VSGAPVMAGERIVGVITTADLLAFQASTPGVPTAHAEEPEYGEWIEPTQEEEIEQGNAPGGAFFTDLWEDAGADVTERMEEVAGPEWNVLDEHEVDEVMTRLLWSLPPDAPVTRAADLMRRMGVHRVLVVDGGKLAGIVSASDIARAVADHKLTSTTYVFNHEPGFGRPWS
ncbi:MAG TPA: CBS domain-containing protein, partial [Gemmatimonadaceae bacterium]|nr:CBS domain-containing protein [Gemmatimonadaceae bacterium]